MKVGTAFAFRKLFATVEETLKTAFSSETVNPSDNSIDFGIGIILHPDFDSESGEVRVYIKSPAGKYSGSVMKKNYKLSIPSAISIDGIKMTFDEGAGQYNCAVFFGDKVIYDAPLFDLTISAKEERKQEHHLVT